MKIIGIGTDIVSTSKFRNMREDQQKKWFTDKEIEYCKSKYYPHQHLAARWAAKESFIKATGLSMSVGMKNIEIQHDATLPSGQHAPIIVLHDQLRNWNNLEIFVSLSHTTDYATATVVIEQ